MRLSDFKGRDNNFNLIRMLAAISVMVSHAFGITDSAGLRSFHHIFGVGPGDAGVDVFFLLSGFLVSKSLSGKNWREFVWARCLRIYPALIVSTILSVVIVGVFFCQMPLAQFLISRTTVSYVIHNITMLPTFGARLNLAHAFGQPNPVFNVSLWTLPHELEMYLLLGSIGFCLGLKPAYAAVIAATGAIVAILESSAGVHVILIGIDRARFMYFFFTGVLAYTLRNRIVFSAGWVVLSVAFLAGAIALPLISVARETVFALVLPYLLLWAAYVPAGWLRLWNRVGDYSYGTYICACPIQSGLFATGIAVTPWRNLAVGVILVLPVAAASWHLIESRALKVGLPQAWRPRVEI